MNVAPSPMPEPNNRIVHRFDTIVADIHRIAQAATLQAAYIQDLVTEFEAEIDRIEKEQKRRGR